jgi:SNF family Na+-dependent transporter
MTLMQIMFQVTINFFQKAYKKDLSAEGQLEFLNMWYIMIIVNDVLIILGSGIKEQIERNVSCSLVMLYVYVCISICKRERVYNWSK